MKEIEMNKKAWGMIAKDHYETFYQALKNEKNLLNNIIIREIKPGKIPRIIAEVIEWIMELNLYGFLMKLQSLII